ncbi:MAG: DUF2393 family protein [Campylobacterota bacterium]|nr:DUF2393 family protein [Campylobacterota bacterium]
MMTYFTIWHYFVVLVVALLFAIVVIVSWRNKNHKLRFSMIFSGFISLALVAAFLIMALDKYTKVVKITSLKNRRSLATEKIIYTGIVRNVGKYTIGKVELEIKLVNKGHVTGNVKGGSFYKPSGIKDFLSSATKKDDKPQTLLMTFVIAEQLKAGRAKSFKVTMPYPPYFKSTSHFTRVFAH